MTGNISVFLITGASSGIGAATARLVAEQGYRIVLAARRLELIELLADEIVSTGGEAYPVRADVTELADIQSLVGAALERYGQIDALFNNAGFGRMGWLEDLEPIEDVAQQINTNLLGLVQMTRAVLPHMIARKGGHIINMASMAGLVATPTYTVYAAGKFGVRGFSEALRREVGVHGIQVSLLFPGGVQNEFSQKARIMRRTGLTTPGWLRLTNEDVAGAVLGLLQRPRRSLVIPWPMHLVVFVNHLFPGMLDRAMERWFVRQERDS